jgi:chromosome segregation ATPase
MSDTSPEHSGDRSGEGRWLTYDELGRIRGIGRESAVKLVQRKRWRRIPGNDGVARALVPDDWLTPVKTDIGEHSPEQSGEHSPEVHAFETALAAIEAAHASEVAVLKDQIASAEQARAGMRAMLEQFADQLRDVDQIIKADRARSDALLADAQARADRTEASIVGERSRADALRDRLDSLQHDLDTANAAAQQAAEAAEALRAAEAKRKARGLLARLRAAMRRE